MAKKNDTTNLKDIGKGILDTISEVKEPKDKVVEEQKSDIPLTENNNESNEENSNMVNNESSNKINNNNTNDKKSKRSFMLTDTAIQRLNLLKLCMNDKDLSELVESAINDYFNKNKKSVESLIDIYNKVK